MLPRRTTIFTQVFYIASVILLFCQMSLAAATAAKKKASRSSSVVESAALTDVSVSDEVACFNFSIGNPQKKEFYSPNYPNHYPKNTKCVMRLTAHAGHMVMLDFRDQFHLENSATCEYDYLEVRDGAYGYSPLIGQYCGSDFPSKMYSSKRYMWLQFSSDDSIEYEGFRAVFDYVPIPNQGPNGYDTDRECAYSRSGHSGIIEKRVDVDPYFLKYRQDDTIECMWTIQTEAGKQLYMNFLKYQLEKPNDCDQNFIQVFGDGRTPDKLIQKFCGTTSEPQKSHTNTSHIRLFTHKDAFNGTDFILHYTSFRAVEKDETCDPQTEFNCGDQTCIHISLKCDGQYDCKYRYDEDPSICATALGAGIMLTSEHMIIILVVFFSLVIAMCASISISCYNKIKERQLREREYKERRSKEASVEATIDRSLRDTPQATLRDDESSDGGCYVPEVDLSVFNKQRSNGGDTIPKKLRAAPMQQYPYISESFESLQSDVIVPPAPPPVPQHMRERRSPPPPTYRIVGGKVVANPARNDPTIEQRPQAEPTPESRVGSTQPWDSRPGSAKSHLGGYNRPTTDVKEKEPDPKSSWLRGPLEAGAPRSAFSRVPGEIGLPKFGMSRVTPDSGSRGPLAAKAVPLAAFREDSRGGYRPGANRNYPARANQETELLQRPPTEASDSSRAHSVASTLSAPDALLKR